MTKVKHECSDNEIVCTICMKIHLIYELGNMYMPEFQDKPGNITAVMHYTLIFYRGLSKYFQSKGME